MEASGSHSPTWSPEKSDDELFVSTTPGNSSSGFANTFRILENQIKRKLLKRSSLGSISEEEPSPLELELAARSRLTELCDTNVFKSEPNISLTTLNKFDDVQDFIYHVSKSRSGALSLRPKRLTPATDDYGNLTFCLLVMP